MQQPEALIGRWQGHVAWRDATTPVMLEVARSDDSLAAMFSAPALGVEELPIGKLSYDPPRVHFTVRDARARSTFDGWLRRGLVVGAFSSDSLGRAQPLAAAAALAPAAARRAAASCRGRRPPGVDSAPPPAPDTGALARRLAARATGALSSERRGARRLRAAPLWRSWHFYGVWITRRVNVSPSTVRRTRYRPAGSSCPASSRKSHEMR